MVQYTAKNRWKDDEVEVLRVGYVVGASLKVLAAVLKRSETSINKALVRFGVRPLGSQSRGKKPGYSRKRHLTVAAFRKIMKDRQIFPLESLILEDVRSTDLGGADKHDNTLAQGGRSSRLARGLPLLSLKRKRNNMPLSPWIDLKLSLQWLKQTGDHVKIHSFSGNQVYLVNGKPLTSAQVVMRLNRRRLDQGLEPVLVDSVTQH